MNKFPLLFFLVLIFGATTLISCNTNSDSDSSDYSAPPVYIAPPPSNVPANVNISTSMKISNPYVSIKQSNDGNIYTFEAVLSDALKDRVFAYNWLLDYGYIDESEHTSEDGKTLTFDVTDFPADTYFVYLAAYDITPLPRELEEEVSEITVRYSVYTSFDVIK